MKIFLRLILPVLPEHPFGPDSDLVRLANEACCLHLNFNLSLVRNFGRLLWLLDCGDGTSWRDMLDLAQLGKGFQTFSRCDQNIYALVTKVDILVWREALLLGQGSHAATCIHHLPCREVLSLRIVQLFLGEDKFGFFLFKLGH